MKFKLLSIGIILIALSISACTVLDKLDRRPAVPDNYSQQIDGLMPTEASYPKWGNLLLSHTPCQAVKIAMASTKSGILNP